MNLIIFISSIVIYQVLAVTKVKENCLASDENIISCYKGEIVPMILRNRGKETFLPKLSGTYNITAVQIGALTKHCEHDCQGITIDVYGKTVNGHIVKCATLEPSSSGKSQPYVLCKRPMTVESLFVTIHGRLVDLVYLETYHLKFHYNMKMMEPPCSSSTPFPYVATDGEPCAFPFYWGNALHYNCIQKGVSSRFECSTTCQNKSPTFVECLSLYPVPLLVENTAILMSSKAPSSADPTAIIDRTSAYNFSECILTGNSERESLKGAYSDLNWVMIDLKDFYVIEMVRLWMETPNRELELGISSGIEVWISGNAPSIERNKELGGFSLSEQDKNQYQFCGKVSESSLVTVSNVFNIYCSKPTVGRYVFIQKSRTALKFCEAEFYRSNELLPCVVNGKATLDCQWKDEIIPVFAKKKNIYESPTFSRLYVLHSFNITALSNCTKCPLAMKLMAKTNEGKWKVCRMLTEDRMKYGQSLSFSVHSTCMQNLYINKIKVFIYHGVVDLVKLRILLNDNGSLTPTYNQNDIRRIDEFSRGEPPKVVKLGKFEVKEQPALAISSGQHWSGHSVLVNFQSRMSQSRLLLSISIICSVLSIVV